jgi:antagonist of KipI
MAILIEKPGVLTTVQDLGRPHLRARGFPSGGAVDTLSLRCANLHAGNAESAAALECALVGPVLRFTHETHLAIAGARVAGLPHCRRFRVGPRESLNLSSFAAGAYAYVAIAGGINVPEILGGRGTDVRLGFGGLAGRALRAGDRLSAKETEPTDAHAEVPTQPLVSLDPESPIRILDGRDADLVSPSWVAHPFAVSAKSDRVGVRLTGLHLESRGRGDAVSCAVFPGTIQLPGDGVPIVLLADAQTLGGYPQVAHVIRADLPRLAQRRPGMTIRFERVTLDRAHALARRHERDLATLRYGLTLARENA